MRKFIILLLSVIVAFSFAACSGSDDEQAEEVQQTEVEELEKSEVADESADESEKVEPMIETVEGFTLLQSLFIALNHDRSYDEVKRIAQSCGFAVEEDTTSKGIDRLIIYNKDEGLENSDVLVIAFDENGNVDDAKYNIEANRWFIELTSEKGYAVDHPGTFLDGREEKFEISQAIEAFEYALSLTDAYQGE